MIPSKYLSLLCLALVVVLVFHGSGAAHAQLNPDFGLLRIDNVKYPRQVAPSTSFTSLIDVEYSLRTNATIKADLYEGAIDNLGAKLWESQPTFVFGGGDRVWPVNLTAPSQEQTWTLTVIPSYLNSGQWVYLNNTSGNPGFFEMTIKIARNAQLTVALGIPNISITIQSVPYSTPQTGQVTTRLPVGKNYSIAIPPMIELQNSTRLLFVGWQDGVNGSQRSVLLDGDSAIIASYRAQYMLHVGSTALGMTNSSWQDAGSTVTLTANTTVPLSGPLAPLGLTYTFNGWTGDVQSTASQINVTMNDPKAVTANYTLDYTPLAIPAIIIVAVLSAVVFLLTRRRSGEPPAPPAPTAQEPVPSEPAVEEKEVETEHAKHCENCGRDVESDWAHCIFCGKPLTSSEPVQS